MKIAALYYDTLPAYMEAIFTLTQRAVSTDEEDVAKQAIEFWCSICEEEMDLIEVRHLHFAPISLPTSTMEGCAPASGLCMLTCQVNHSSQELASLPFAACIHSHTNTQDIRDLGCLYVECKWRGETIL